MAIEFRSVRKVVSDGMHNAFTALAFYKDRFHLVFRSGAKHADNAGRQVLMTSADGREWERVPDWNPEFPFRHGSDYRDSYLLPLGDELRLYSFSTPLDAEGERIHREER